MQIVIDIKDGIYGLLKYFEGCLEVDKKDDDVKTALMRAIVNGTPLDDVKAEIEQICQDIDTCSHNEYENAVEQGKEIAYENVLDILDNIGKAESEEKPNE